MTRRATGTILGLLIGVTALAVAPTARSDTPQPSDTSSAPPQTPQDQAAAARRQRAADRAGQAEAAAQADLARRQAATQRRADARAAQAATDDADRASDQARLQTDEDQQLAALRAQLGPGFGTTTCADLPAKAVAPTTAPFEGNLPVVEHDTLDDVAADRADTAALQTSFDQLRCYALHRIARPFFQAALRSAGGDPDALAVVTQTMKQSPAYYPTVVAKTVQLEPKVRAVVTRRQAQEAADEACIAKPGCIDARVVKRIGDQICGAIAQKTELTAQIAHEKANPSGVVDLVALHDMGTGVQTANDQIRDLKATYLEKAKRPFVAASCGGR